MRIMNGLAPVAIIAATLGGCHKSASISADNVSVAELDAKLKAAGLDHSQMRAGKWQSTVAIDSMEAPGMPPEAAAQMKRVTSQTHSSEACLTPDQVKRPKPEFFAQAQKNCRYDHFEFGNGKMDMTMRCGGTGMPASVIHMTGAYTPETSHIAMSSTSDTGAGGIGQMTMKMHVDGKRVGECDQKNAG